MNNLLKVPLVILIIFLSPILIYQIAFRIAERKTNVALNDYSMLPGDVEVVDKVTLGRGTKQPKYLLKKGLKRSALELVCTNKGDILLVMKDDVKYTTSNKKATFYTDFRIEDGVKKGRAEIKEMSIAYSGKPDPYFIVMASSPLSKQELNSMIKALHERTSRAISLSLSESAYGFGGDASISDVNNLIEQCNSK